MVPMVMTIEGTRVQDTRRPLKAPQARPTASPVAISTGTGAPWLARSPIDREASATMAATDRSISRMRINSAIPSAMMAFSEKL